MKTFRATSSFRWVLVHKGKVSIGMVGGLENGTNYTQFLQQAWQCDEDGEIEWRFLSVTELNT